LHARPGSTFARTLVVDAGYFEVVAFEQRHAELMSQFMKPSATKLDLSS